MTEYLIVLFTFLIEVMYLLTIHIFFEKMSVQVLCPFTIGLFHFSLIELGEELTSQGFCLLFSAGLLAGLLGLLLESR